MRREGKARPGVGASQALVRSWDSRLGVTGSNGGCFQ